MNKGKQNIMRLLGQQKVSTTPNESFERSSSIDAPQLRPSASQNTIFSAGAPITCLDRSPDGERAVIAGPKVFKILKVDGSTITEEFDLRAIITSYAATHDPSAASPDQLNIKAVQWSHGKLNATIITASGNGRITVYDLNRMQEGLEVMRIQEHSRQVHKLDISPFKCDWLLSASQDGNVKFFFLIPPSSDRSGWTYQLKLTFRCNEPVRDVKWSPTDGTQFACCTDGGLVMAWSIKKPGSAVIKIQAHQGQAFSIAWHPQSDDDYSALISSGMDQHCYVWDMSKKAERNQKPKYGFATVAPVSNISWRPACWSATAQGKRAAQVTVAYDDTHANKYQCSTVHIWDLARPSMPFKEIEQWNSSPTGIIWNTRDLLWSVDREGRFTQTDVAFVPRVIDNRSLSTFAFSPAGSVLMVLEERAIPRRQARLSITSPDASPSFQHVSSTPQFSVSRSDSEEDVVGSFLGPRQPKRHRRRESGGRSSQSLSTTPPNPTGMIDNNVMALDKAVSVTGIYKPQQVVAIGHAPSAAKRQTFQYFTNRYLLRIANYSSPEMGPTNTRTALILEYFGRTAERVGHYRLAQTWRLLGYTITLLLTRRAEFHRESRLAVPELPPKKDKLKGDFQEFDNLTDRGTATPRRPIRSRTPRSQTPRNRTPHDSPHHRPMHSIISEDLESTSNVATPLVRPVRDHIAAETREAMRTPINMVEDDLLHLPDPAHASSTSPGPIPVPGAFNSEGNRTSSVEGYDFYGMDSFSPAVDFHAPRRKPPFRLDSSTRNSPTRRIQPERHDSGESFQMFSTSGESHQPNFLSSSSSENGQSLRDRVSGWENSLSMNGRHRPSVDSDAPTQSESSDERFKDNSSASSLLAPNGVSLNPAFPPVFRLQGASAPSTDHNWTTQSPAEEETAIRPSPEKPSEDPNIIETDYLPWPKDPSFTIPPIDPTVLVQRAINFEAQTGALNAAVMILLLRPLLPVSAIDNIQANAILRQYHQRLTTLRLFTEAALLRNLAVPDYPSIFARAQERVNVGYFCTDCNKPLDPDPLISNSVWRCPSCKKMIDACAICRQRDLDPAIRDSYAQEPAVFDTGAVWFLCPGCGHGGHSACLQAWHALDGEESGGCCPLEGCLHPCLPGAWRQKRWEERKAAVQREVVRKGVGRGGVRRDQREVTQSKAVEGVRHALHPTGLIRTKSVKWEEG